MGDLQYMKISFFILLFFSGLTASAQPISIGVIADCQYCDCAYSKQWTNDYSSGLPRLKEAVDTFNLADVKYTFHLGDFIDRDFASYGVIIPVYEQLEMPHYHVLGNHDFSVADSLKNLIPLTLGLDANYYTLNQGEWEFIFLDGTDISLYNTTDSTQLTFAEKQRLTYLRNGRTQALPWNGAIGQTQLTWLNKELKKAEVNQKKVLIFCHFPILPKSDANLWNDIELIKLLEKYASVKAYINGHHHPGNYVLHNNIHYLTLKGMVRTKEKNAFAILKLHHNYIEVKGFGREPSRKLYF
jgi:predicted phosphodiesterase